MFYNELDKLCNSKGLTVTSFVKEKLKLSTSKVTAWKNGSIPKYSILERIANYFNVSVGQLFDGVDNTAFDLSELETEFIKNFRALSDQGKRYMLDNMDFAKEKYKNDILPSEADNVE